MEVKDDRKSIITDVPSLVVTFKKKKKERKYSAVVQKVVIQRKTCSPLGSMFSFGQAERKEQPLVLHSERIFANSWR